MNGAKPLRIKFDKVNGLIRVYGGTIYSVLFGSGMPFTIALEILSVKNVALITFISDNYVKIKVDSYVSSLLVEKNCLCIML